MEKSNKIRAVFALLLSLTLLIGAAVCLICDKAISGKLTWSLIPLVSCAFAWVVFFPAIKFSGRGVVISLTALSAALIPYLFALSKLIGAGELFMKIGVRMSAVAIALLWLVFIIHRILGKRKLIAAAVSLLAVIPALVLINVSLVSLIGGEVFDFWDILSSAVIALTSLSLFIMDRSNIKKRKSGR